MKAALFVLLCVACGGRIDDGDGGTGGVDSGATKNDSAASDVSTLPDSNVNPSCKLGMGSGTVSSDGSCSSTQAWACGEINFSITCSCPDAACTCQGGDPKKILTPIACPSCDVQGNLEKLAALCGYPAP